MAPLPLAGIRVADFGWILAAPQCTTWLGVMGQRSSALNPINAWISFAFWGKIPKISKGQTARHSLAA